MRDLSPYEIGVLRSSMSEGSAAMVLGRSPGWIALARQELAPPPAPAQPEGADVGRIEAESQAHPQPPAPAAPAPRCASCDAVNAEPRAWDRREPRCPDCQDVDQAPALAAVEPEQIDLEEVIAAATPLGPMGAPADLKGADLAAWLYDNTAHTFDQIAEMCGLSVDDVATIADGGDPENPAPWETVVLAPAAAAVYEEAPGDVATPAAVNKGGRPKTHVPPATLPEIPARVLRWARWFVDAHWRYADVAFLFDVPEEALRWALSPRGVR